MVISFLVNISLSSKKCKREEVQPIIKPIYFVPSNINNLFDFVGEYHNKGLDYVYLYKDELTKNSILWMVKLTEIVDKFICDNKNDIQDNAKKAFSEIKDCSKPNANECGMQKIVYNYLNEIFSAIKFIDTTDNNSFKNFPGVGAGISTGISASVGVAKLIDFFKNN